MLTSIYYLLIHLIISYFNIHKMYNILLQSNSIKYSKMYNMNNSQYNTNNLIIKNIILYTNTINTI